MESSGRVADQILQRPSLYVHSLSSNCAVSSKCIVCLYKLIPKTVMSKLTGFSIPPNKRPETCPRFNSVDKTQFSSTCGLYHHSDRLLTVGDGDFSFSLSLVKGGHDPTRLTATSYEPYKTLISVYDNFQSILQQLNEFHVPVYHGVDATQLACSHQISKQAYDIVIWNFPCLGAAEGADGQANEIEANQNLLRTFFANVTEYLDPQGRQEVHITHKTIEPFSWWDIVSIGVKSGWDHCGSFLFDRCLYPGYINRKALDKKSFPCVDALVCTLHDIAV